MFSNTDGLCKPNSKLRLRLENIDLPLNYFSIIKHAQTSLQYLRANTSPYNLLRQCTRPYNIFVTPGPNPYKPAYPEISRFLYQIDVLKQGRFFLY